jgi:hypothetical protein
MALPEGPDGDIMLTHQEQVGEPDPFWERMALVVAPPAVHCPR